jgi:hypothetical protein
LRSRYEENREENILLMDSKEIICEIFNTIFQLKNEFRITKFMQIYRDNANALKNQISHNSSRIPQSSDSRDIPSVESRRCLEILQQAGQHALDDRALIDNPIKWVEKCCTN